MSHEVLVIKVRENNSPIMSEFRGYRILVAVPNLQGTKFNGGRTVNFNKPYLVHESLDLTIDDVPKYSAELKVRFKDCVFVTADVVEQLEIYAGNILVPHKERPKDNEAE